MQPSIGGHFARAWDFARRASRVLREELTGIDASKACAEAVTSLIPHLSCNYLRTLIWRGAGLVVGERVRIMGPLYITGHRRWRERLSLGADTLITGPVHIDLEAPVSIGDRVHLGHDVMLLTANHEFGSSGQRCGRLVALPIQIGDGAWLASRAVVLPGVSIGRGAVVAAGAVVTRDVPRNALVAGVPARIVRRLEEQAVPESARVRCGPQDKTGASRARLRAAS